MENKKNFYINGKWVTPKSKEEIKVIDPATEENCATITLGNKDDVNEAVNAAKKAYSSRTISFFRSIHSFVNIVFIAQSYSGAIFFSCRINYFDFFFTFWCYPFAINIKIFFIFHRRLLTFLYFFANRFVNS